jgi:hypothetical protein
MAQGLGDGRKSGGGGVDGPDGVRELDDVTKMPCGWAVCDCSWATGGPDGFCSTPDNPRTECWGCCCEHLFPEDYHRSMSSQPPTNTQPQWGNGDQGNGPNHGSDPYVVQWGNGFEGNHHYHNDVSYDPVFIGGRHHHHHRVFGGRHEHAEKYYPGEKVRVEGRHGIWKQATIHRQVSPRHYEVHYLHSHRVEVVPSDRIALDTWTPVWEWILFALMGICLLSICIGLVGFIMKVLNDKKKPPPRWEPPLPPPEEDKNRTCTWCTS